MLNQNAAYSFQHHFNFSVYGDSCFLAVQECIIILEIWWFDRSLSKTEISLMAMFYICYITFLYTNNVLTDKNWDVVNIASSFISKLLSLSHPLL